jgi:hypothetical protein
MFLGIQKAFRLYWIILAAFILNVKFQLFLEHPNDKQCSEVDIHVKKQMLCKVTFVLYLYAFKIKFQKY